jgi:hypothetical protein
MLAVADSLDNWTPTGMKASAQGVRRRKTAAVKGVSVQASSGTFAIPPYLHSP